MTTHSNTRPSTALPLWLAAAVLTLTGVASSHAQQPAGNARTFISVNGGLQALTGSFTESVVFPESGGVYREVLPAAAAQEQARLKSDYRYRTGPLFDEGVVKVHVATGSKWGDTLSCGYAEKHKERRCRRWKRPIGACRSLQKALNRTDGVRAISRRRLWALA